MSRKVIVWTLLSLPGVVLILQFATDATTYGQSIHWSGQLSVGLLILTMSLTPLRCVISGAWFAQVMAHRRAIGVASFGYAAIHTGLYVEHKWGANLIIKEGLDPDLASGWIAFLVLLLLAATSNSQSVRWLGQRWQKVHRLVYLAAFLTFAHWGLASFDAGIAIACAGLLVAIELLRLRRLGAH
ncbi:MAG: sulfite oxidase subunit YedZ [Pseudomonadales bacterium]|nr:sulfite oxidase subunit YedZ [Pseudomonadales bacterium]